MPESPTAIGREWEDALDDAVCAHPEPRDGLLLFLEEREDLTVVMDEGGRPRVVSSYSRGLSVRGPEGRSWTLHRSDPGIDDAERMVRSATDPQAEFPLGRAGKAGDDASIRSALCPDEAARTLAILISGVSHRHPGAAISGRLVGFDQHVLIVRAGAPTRRDLRRGRRVRLEVQPTPDRPARVAVAEAILPLDGSFSGHSGWIEELSAAVGRGTEAVSAEPGEREIVLGPSVGGILAHEIVGHALEADIALAGGSWLASAVGEIANPAMTILDDPRRGRAPWKIDDEGEPARPVPLLRDGSVGGLLHDLASARRSGERPTGHGRRSSFREPVRPRMGCTFVVAGESDPTEVLEGVADGVYVRRMEAAKTDPRSGKAVFRVTDADRIIDGSLAEPLLPLLLHVHGGQALCETRLIADDLVFDRCVGSCHRDGQPLAISVGAPTMCIGRAMVRG